MNNFVFSSEKSCFYSQAWRDAYISNNTWPIDAVDVTDEIYYKYSCTPPEGKVLGTEGNQPTWVDCPPPTQKELIAAAEQQKAALLAEAQATISLWQTELQLGIISDEDKASLIAWMNYIKAVQAVDTSTAPDINWPYKPGA